VAVAAQPATTDLLSAKQHNPNECPQGVVGKWTKQDVDGQFADVGFNFEGPALVETFDTTAAGFLKQDRKVFDGVVRPLNGNPGMSVWYVGACNDGVLRESTVFKTNSQISRLESKTTSRRGRLITKHVDDTAGYKTFYFENLSRKFEQRHRH
jgi:hypothetical protein